MSREDVIRLMVFTGSMSRNRSNSYDSIRNLLMQCILEVYHSKQASEAGIPLCVSSLVCVKNDCLESSSETQTMGLDSVMPGQYFRSNPRRLESLPSGLPSTIFRKENLLKDAHNSWVQHDPWLVCLRLPQHTTTGTTALPNTSRLSPT